MNAELGDGGWGSEIKGSRPYGALSATQPRTEPSREMLQPLRWVLTLTHTLVSSSAQDREHTHPAVLSAIPPSFTWVFQRLLKNVPVPARSAGQTKGQVCSTEPLPAKGTAAWPAAERAPGQ